MKKWIKRMLGIRSECERHAEIGQWMAQGFADGLEKGMDKSDMSTLSTIYGQDCPFCEGTGITYFGQGLDEHHICGMCRGSGKEIPSSRAYLKIDPGVLAQLKEQAKDAGQIISDKLKDTMWAKTETEQMIGHPKRDNHTIIDPMIKEFTSVVWAQQEKVLASGKYEHPIHKDNFPALGWIDHQMAEFADGMVYHECLKQTIQDAIDLIEKAYKKSTDEELDEYLVDALIRLRG